MFWAWFSKVSILIALILCIDFAITSTEECFSTVKHGLYYSKRASNSSGELLKTFENLTATECQRNCCNFGQCNLMMFSTVLRDYEKSTNITCFLFNCPDLSRCITKPLPRNITGVSIIGIKRENITNLDDSSNYNNSNLEQHQIYTPSSNSTVRTSGIQPSISTIVPNTYKPDTILNSNITTFNNSNMFGLPKTTNLPPNIMHSPLSFTPNPMESIGNVSHSTLSTVTPSISSGMNMPGIPLRSNHSSYLLSYSHLKSMHNTNRSTLSTVVVHSIPTLGIHTPAIQLESNHSSLHFVLLSGSYSAPGGLKPSSNVNHTINKISHTLSHSMFASVVVTSLKISDYNADSHVATSSPFVHASPHYTNEVLSTMPSLEALVVNPNVSSSFLANHQDSESSHSPATTSHTSKGDQKISRKFSERESHTTPASLVISLIFGILFFATVVFLIGRRWSEQCLRRGYSRVDYLLNDYD